jgi:hypothetical protein
VARERVAPDDDLISAIGRQRFERYLGLARNDPALALAMYEWNLALGAAAHPLLAMWEVTLRNRLDGYFVQRYGDDWPIQFAVRERLLPRQIRDMVSRALGNLRREGFEKPDRGQVISSLSCGFWVAQFSRAGIVPHSLAGNLGAVFADPELVDPKGPHAAFSRLLFLRNRIAHHEPILHLDLADMHDMLLKLLGALSPAAGLLARRNNQLPQVLAARPGD